MLKSHTNNSNLLVYPDDAGVVVEEYSVARFFHKDSGKHDDLKDMLDSNKDALKLDAMKRIIVLLAKGHDASRLFPAVIKNVVSKNVEIKKLVYVYLGRHAEEQKDLALLSIASFQRALKEPNQLIRAGALRVLSTIRVKILSPIIILAIRNASLDMSSYVRTTAAYAIPKLYSVDPDLKTQLVHIIQKLLDDETVLVIGSAMIAFQEVCPEKFDLIHQVYRKLCAVLNDVDEWGQVTIIGILTRYVRSQFTNPNFKNQDTKDESFNITGSYLDPEHKLLLRCTKPLLQSRNAAVVMAVSQLYYHTAPKSDMFLAAKALVRFLRSHKEIQCLILNAIASISVNNKAVFGNFLKSFFVRSSDTSTLKLLKLSILTNLSTKANVSAILEEFQTYILHTDKRFVAATIQAIGRVACSISEVTVSCLQGLLSLLSNRDEAIVAESIIVIKTLLQNKAADPKQIVTHMVKLLDNITVPQAKAVILWLLGEHSQEVPVVAPDVLRKMAKTFPEEDDTVKMQILNLSMKLYISNPDQTALLCQYTVNLAKYDPNYDIRDKARFLKAFLIRNDGVVNSKIDMIFLASKPAGAIQSTEGQKQFLLGSLAHYVKEETNGYKPLPSFPKHPSSGKVRNVGSSLCTRENQMINNKGDGDGKFKSILCLPGEIDIGSSNGEDASEEEEEDDSREIEAVSEECDNEESISNSSLNNLNSIRDTNVSVNTSSTSSFMKDFDE